jgi:hypothetical protein
MQCFTMVVIKLRLSFLLNFLQHKVATGNDCFYFSSTLHMVSCLTQPGSDFWFKFLFIFLINKSYLFYNLQINLPLNMKILCCIITNMTCDNKVYNSGNCISRIIPPLNIKFQIKVHIIKIGTFKAWALNEHYKELNN